MPRRFTLGDLVTMCQQRCDMENQTSISTTEWKRMISTTYGDLHSLVSSTGLRYFETSTTITATGAASYSEPADHLSTIGVDYVVNSSTGQRRALYELMPQERNRFTGMTGQAVAFMLVDDALSLWPKPSSGSYVWLYIPQPPHLAALADAEVIDVITPDGESFLVWGVAVQAKAKEESDTNHAEREREAARQRVIEWATMRNILQPRRRIVEDDVDIGYRYPGDWLV